MDKEILSDLGLSDREIAVYIALYKLSSTTTGPLVKASGVQNAKIYETLDKLKKKGLATYVLKGKTKHFQATDPSTLLNFFDEKREKLKKLIQELKSLRERREPEYESRIYEGVRAIKAVFYEMYDYIGRNAEYCVFPIGEQLKTEELVNFWAQVLRKAIGMKIKIRTLPHKKLRKIFKKFYSKYKFLNVRYTTQGFPTGIFIFKDHMLSVTWDNVPVATLIKSRENYIRWQKFFDEQWEISKE